MSDKKVLSVAAANELVDEIATLRQSLAASEEQYRNHLAHVQRFLVEMYQTMVDPLDDFQGNVEELCTLLLNRAREDRESMHAAEARELALREALTQIVLEVDQWGSCNLHPKSSHIAVAKAALASTADHAAATRRDERYYWKDVLKSNVTVE